MADVSVVKWAVVKWAVVKWAVVKWAVAQVLPGLAAITTAFESGLDDKLIGTLDGPVADRQTRRLKS
jgi:hypothetical protein